MVKDKYLGSSLFFNYPSVDDIVKKVLELGPGSLLYKVDISRAFRQLKVDPGVTYLGHYISTLYITYIRHYISALFNLSFMFIHCHKR